VASGREQGKKSSFRPVSRTADMPGQTVNVDLLFVPACHEANIKLPAVSGSSGHLVVERLKEIGQEPDYPGKVFINPDLDYVEAMQAFVEASQPLSGPRKVVETVENPSRRVEIRQLRQKEAEICLERHRLRQVRKAEDDVWRAARAQPHSEEPAQPKLRARWGSSKRKAELRRTLREQRHQQLTLRQQEDQQWRLDRQGLRERMNLLPLITTWIAILLVTDNCTRQCLGLPLFVAGSHVTAEMVVAALRILLPADLQFLISDRGVHFTAQVFQQLATETNFVHVVIARHRPQSNGIAERFVRTIKEWLADKTWATDQELFAWLNIFLPEFNDRPHQGLPIPGLSPNEFANRLWLM